MKINIVDYSENVNQTIAKINNENIINRIWKKDHTVWRSDPFEISNRLGWLDCIEITSKSFNEINSFVDEIKAEGFTNALLMGMGGSSLAPEVFRLTFGVKEGYLDLSVIDSTHPDAVNEMNNKLDKGKTLFIVSTKSGGTIETISFLKFFYTVAAKKLGKEKAGNQFIAITDPGSGLEKMAQDLGFRKIFLNDPNIGGRFSALSLFGIVPAALIGIEIEKVFSKASKVIDESKSDDLQINKSAKLGATVGALAKEGLDKLTIITSPQLKYLGGWLEQLVAESTGKDGKGILPVDLESVLTAENYCSDRVFIYIRLKADSFYNEKVKEFMSAGFPLIEIELEDIYEIAGEFFRWEFATAIAGYVLDVQPFDQPNVESAKIEAKAMMKEFSETGKLPRLNPVLTEKGITVFGDVKSENLNSVLIDFLSSTVEGTSYVALQAYLKPDEKTWSALQELRFKIHSKYKIATTLGYGPRFLHSTGQLHKGDGGNGLFIQLAADCENDATIPEKAGEEKSSITFYTLINAQALGDRQALINNNRKVIQFHLGKNISEGLKKLAELI